MLRRLALLGAVVAVALSVSSVAALAFGPERTWSTATEPGMTPVGLAVEPSGRVLALGQTSLGFRVDEFSAEGSRLTSWDGTGTSGGPLDRPLAIAADSAGTVFVAERDRVRRFTTSGIELGQWNTTGPRSLAIGPTDVVYVLAGDGTLERRRADGSVLSRWPLPGTPFTTTLAVAPAGNVYFASDRIFALDASGKLIRQFAFGQAPAGLALTADGLLWGTDVPAGRVRGYASDGSTFVECVGGPASGGATAASGGRLFVASAATVVRYGPGGTGCRNLPLKILGFETIPTSFPPADKRNGRAAAFSFEASSDTRVSITLSRLTRGVVVKGKCLRTGKSGGKRCSIATSAGSITARAIAGKNAIDFSGWLPRKRLTPGLYQARLVAKDSHGRSSRPVTTKFRVL